MLHQIVREFPQRNQWWAEEQYNCDYTVLARKPSIHTHSTGGSIDRGIPISNGEESWKTIQDTRKNPDRHKI